MTYTSPLPNGARQINKLYTFCDVLATSLPLPSDRIEDIIQRFDAAVKTEYPAVTMGALNNAHGDWFEWLLSIAAWNAHIKGKTPFLAIPLPNINQFDCAKLYVPELYQMIQHLRQETIRSSNVQLISSNPDFVLLSVSDIAPIGLAGFIHAVTEETLQKLDMAHLHFQSACGFETIRGYLAAKLSFRPDRRLQVPHEGSLVKALYVHLQTRLWIAEPPGIKYYAMAAHVSEADKNALRTVATHSITTVSSKPQSAVDAVFEIATWQQAEEAFLTILAL
jgi:hypothetical protein